MERRGRPMESRDRSMRPRDGSMEARARSGGPREDSQEARGGSMEVRQRPMKGGKKDKGSKKMQSLHPESDEELRKRAQMFAAGVREEQAAAGEWRGRGEASPARRPPSPPRHTASPHTHNGPPQPHMPQPQVYATSSMSAFSLSFSCGRYVLMLCYMFLFSGAKCH
jgi:hypothetical protein